ncbi:MAG: hypothetical protein Kow0098_03040 [Ignavibacteriaceae bacterium]
MMKNLFIAVLISLSVSYPQSNNLQQELVNIMKAEFKAFQTSDPSLWSVYVHEDAVFTGMQEGFQTRQDIMNEMRKASDLYKNSEEEYSGIMINEVDNTAVLTCYSTLKYTDSAGQISEMSFRFIRVHIKKNGKWMLIFHNSIPL